MRIHLVHIVRLSLSAESVSHSAVFFSHNKSANSTFYHDLSDKQYFLPTVLSALYFRTVRIYRTYLYCSFFVFNLFDS